MRIGLVIFLIFLTGCASSRQIEDFRPYLKEDQLAEIGSSSLDDIKKHFFTEEAYQAIKDIPLVVGPAITGYAAGTTFLSQVASFLTFNGVGRKVILTSDFLNLEILIHEYIHHLDDMTRDGEANFIDLPAFQAGYQSCYRHPYYHGITIYVESASNQWYTNLFGIGKYSEHIAYTGARIALQRCPDKLAWAFRKILRKYENTAPP